jgi:hypothetical protein
MDSDLRADLAPDLDDGSWAYLSLGEGDDALPDGLRSRVTEACRSSGWPAVTWSRPTAEADDPRGDRFWIGIDHAVEHADVVVTLLGAATEVTEAELQAAFRYGRPVIGLRLPEGGTGGSDLEARLSQYGRGRLVDCVDLDDCGAALRQVLTDEDFAQTIREATVGEALR